ncbi:MAG: hypothetical protein JWP48_3519 [Actinoallomurus sp.]|nr:hypothetical protein [Actinoallomurus sp.]
MPGRAPRTTTCLEAPPPAVPDLSAIGVTGRAGPRTRRGTSAALCGRTVRTVRLLLTGVGLAIAFWAFGVLSQAHADVLPHRDSGRLSQVTRPIRAALPAPTRTVRVSPVRTRARPVVGGLTKTPRVAGASGKTAVVHAAPLIGTRKHPLLTTLRDRTGLPRLPDVRRVTGLPGTTVQRAARLPSLTEVHGAVRGAGALTRTRNPYSPRPPSEPGAGAGCARRWTPAAPARRPGPVTRAAPVDPPRLDPVTTGPASRAAAPSRMKRTGAITHTPQRPVRVSPPTPVPAPVSGSGGSDSGGGKTSSGAGDVPRLSLPACGLWSMAHQTSTMPSRNIADKPSFSPD